MKAKHYAYLAGLIDGDGCINASVATTNRQTWYRLHISVNSVNKKPLIQLTKWFGGTVKPRNRNHYKNGVIWEWRLVVKAQVKGLLENITPFLVIKQPQAVLAIRFVNLTGPCPQERESLIREVQRLNQTQENNAPLCDFKKLNWAYLAGIMDAEGTFTVRKDWRNTYVHYGIWARLGNTNSRLIEWLETYFGGKAVRDDKAFYWPLPYSRKEKETFLLNLLPYLITKKEQAKILLEYIRLGDERNPVKRDELYEKCFALNHPSFVSEVTNLCN